MKLRRYAIALSIAVGAGALAYLLTTLQLFEGNIGQLESKTLDYRMRSSQTIDPERTDVRLVLFDSAFVASWPYLSPFPRAALASLIDAASQAGAKAIGLDVYLDRQYPALNAIDSGDVKLHNAIKRAGNVVLVAPTVGNSQQRTLLPPDPYFADVAAAVSSADTPTPYETIRDGVLVVRTDKGLVPSFALAMYAKTKGINLDSLLKTAERKGELDIPHMPAEYTSLQGEATKTIPISFEGPSSATDRDDGTFKTVSAFAVAQLAGIPGAAQMMLDVKDKAVLLGSGFHDSERYRSPFYDMRRKTGEVYGWTYGVEVHANALQNLLSGHFEKPLAWVWCLLLGLALAAVVSLVTFARGTKWGAFSAVAVSAATAALAVVIYRNSNVVVPMVAPSLASLFAFLGATSYVSIVEGKEKRMIKGAFGKFVSPAVVDELVADPTKLKLGGEKRLISVLFSDLAGFTSMSERLDPERLVQILNEYLDEMSDIVIKDGGTLDKYIGDAIMALYGAPTAMSDHATACCRTALDMQKALKAMNARWQADDPTWPTLKCRIGINSGAPVVGNIGGEKRFDYTALGDSVNLAARLEPACKSYGVAIMIAQPTREYAGESVQVRELDMLAVYGKKEPVRVYELLALQGEDLGEKKDVLEQYNKGLAAFRNRDFELALQYFKAALELDETDGPSALYIERCEDYAVNPPPADWDFVERRQVK